VKRAAKTPPFLPYPTCVAGHHTTVPVPEGGVTSGITTSACARGDLFTVKPEVCPTPYRARATGYNALGDVVLAWIDVRVAAA
jgi:hypothetical protein